MSTRQFEYFANAFVPKPYSILGVKLLPYCIGHLILLKRFGCVFADDRHEPDAEADVEDFFLAAAICSRTFEGFLELLEGNITFDHWWEAFGNWTASKVTGRNYGERWAIRWGKVIKHAASDSYRHWWLAVANRITLKLTGKTISKTGLIKGYQKFNFLEEFVRFQEYKADGVVVPEYFESDLSRDSEGSGAHWSQSVLQILTANLGYSPSEALNLPLSRAMSENFKYLESQGILTLKSDQEFDLEAATKKWAEEQRKKSQEAIK